MQAGDHNCHLLARAGRKMHEQNVSGYHDQEEGGTDPLKFPENRMPTLPNSHANTIREDQGYYSKSQGFKLNPGMMVQHQASMLQYNLGINIYMMHVYLGLWYKNQTLEYDEFSTFTAMAGLNIPFTEEWRMKLMYSYEMNINAQHNFTGPSHEISLIFEFDDIGLIQKRSGSGFMAPTTKRSNSPIECSPF